MNRIEEKLSCEESRFLISRNLDGDLSREEVCRLYLHLGPCDSCRDALAGMAELESNLEELNRVYEGESLADSFNKKIKDAVQQESAPRKTGNLADLWEWMFPQGWLRPAFTGLAGMAAGFLLFFFLGADGIITPKDSPRFVFHPVEFHEAKDKVEWNQSHTLLPGHTLRKTVMKGHHEPYYFRFRSDGPVDIVVTHDIPGEEDDPIHKFSLHGTRYASLNSPQQGDVIIIRNEGSEPVQISAFTKGLNAVHTSMEKHDKNI